MAPEEARRLGELMLGEHGFWDPVSVACMERFWSKVNKTDECWLWTAGTNNAGYGIVSVGGRRHRAHRYAYELEVGPIAEGLVIDHLCRNRACVNPAHMEPVTIGENVRRGEPANRTHCPQGHAYDEANTYVRPSGKRKCRACHRDNERERYRRRVGQ